MPRQISCGQLVRYAETKDGEAFAVVIADHTTVVHVARGKNLKAAKDQLSEDLREHGLYVQMVNATGGILKHK